MATRRSFMSRMEPAMPMTPRGHTGMMMLMDGAPDDRPLYDPASDPNGPPVPYEAPQAFRRRVLPLVDAPEPGQTVLQQLTSMLGPGMF